MIEFEEEEEEGSGPGWLATFADLMSLLLCFFVLLLSFSEMDLQRYQQIAGSMKMAFGVQRAVRAEQIPEGTSIIAQEFSPGKTDPTPLDTIRQQTQENLDNRLEVGQEEFKDLDNQQTRELLEAKVASLLQETQADAEALRELLADEIQAGQVEVESEGRMITVRIKEKGSFPSGSDQINFDFKPVIDSIGKALGQIAGDIAVEGHTDDVPVVGERIRSNWELSANRALSVAHEMMTQPELDASRLMVAGYADTRPMADNETAEGRASNRRVEIVIRQPVDDDVEEVMQEQGEEASALEILERMAPRQPLGGGA